MPKLNLADGGNLYSRVVFISLVSSELLEGTCVKVNGFSFFEDKSTTFCTCVKKSSKYVQILNFGKSNSIG